MAICSVFLSGKLHGYRNLAGLGAWGRKESDTTKQQQQQEGSYIQAEAEIWAAKPSPAAWSCSSRWGRGRLGGPGVPQAWSRLHPCTAAEEAPTVTMVTCSFRGGNWSSDLPGAHIGQDTSLPGREGIRFLAARRKKVSLFTSES